MSFDINLLGRQRRSLLRFALLARSCLYQLNDRNTEAITYVDSPR